MTATAQSSTPNEPSAPSSGNQQSAAQDIECARSVLEAEINGLNALRDAVGESFARSVETIHRMKNEPSRKGRLIVAGIGKSGHVCRKMAATLASTGTPAFFVHPGEASHGDLGMVTSDDVVLMLSNSGENSELSDLIHYTRRHGITLIAMTSNPDSTLASHCDICLQYPKVPEACPNGMAPTTSTTMMMAFGDALAVALLERMGLTKEQFKVFHPGGKLGQKLQKVSDLMIGYDDLPVVKNSAKMDEAILVLSGKNLGAVIVMDHEDNMLGIITDGDLKRHMAPDLLQKSVVDIMTQNPRSIESTALAAEALDAMTGVEGRYLTSLIVRDSQGALAGMIRLQDCLHAGLV